MNFDFTNVLDLIIIFYSLYLMTAVVDGPFLKTLDKIADWLKLSPSVAGATLLAFGTSTPEISTALIALFLESSDPSTGIGTIVGSAIFQILVVVGFSAIVKTSYLDWKPVIRDSLFYLFSTGLLIFFISDNKFTLWEGLGFVSSYLLYLGILFWWSRNIPEPEVEINDIEETESEKNTFKILKLLKIFTFPIDFLINLFPDAKKKPGTTIPVFLFSLAMIGLACYFMVLSAESLAFGLGIPPSIIALTILAGGTSVPELISSAIVARQGRGDMAIANAIGSNVFDILMSLGLPVLIYTVFNGTLEITGSANINSSIILLFFTLIMVLLLLASQKFKASRPFGFLLIGMYFVYVLAAYSGWIGG